MTMKLVTLPDATTRPLPFYLAEEEWLARRYAEGDFFFMWQVEPTVIIGRNQLAAKEIDIDFCRSQGIRIVRRKSGGGAVLADLNNIMLSYVTTSTDTVAETFLAYTSAVASALRRMGLDASATSRNDVLIGAAKVSGNSYYRLGRRSIVHGTMLYDCDRELMGKVLRPAPAKLRSHGVASVRSRVTTIREHLPDLDIATFGRLLRDNILADGAEEWCLTEADVAEIEAMSQEYHDPARLTRLNPRADVEAEARIEGAGTIAAHVGLREGRVASLTLTGDYLENDDASAILEARLKGAEYTPAGITAALAGFDPGGTVRGLSTEALLQLLF